MLESLLARLRRAIDSIAPSAETLARREAVAVQSACCNLLMEVARLESTGTAQKTAAVAQALREHHFVVADDGLESLIADAARPESRLTSYYEPVAAINRRWGAEQKARLVEQMWRVALADGGIDEYEDQLVRKLADLLYVPHTDLILARRRVENAGDGKRKVAQ